MKLFELIDQRLPYFGTKTAETWNKCTTQFSDVYSDILYERFTVFKVWESMRATSPTHVSVMQTFLHNAEVPKHTMFFIPTLSEEVMFVTDKEMFSKMYAYMMLHKDDKDYTGPCDLNEMAHNENQVFAVATFGIEID